MVKYTYNWILSHLECNILSNVGADKKKQGNVLPLHYCSLRIVACAAASLASGTRYGEQLT